MGEVPARRKFAAVAIITAMLLGLAMRPALAATAEEHRFRELINNERSARGLSPLTLDTEVSDQARRHSQDMAARGSAFHSDSLSGDVYGCRDPGENVGTGDKVEAVHNGLMDSPPHREEILSPVDRVGIGVVWKDGLLYVTQIFFCRSAPAPRPAPAASMPASTVPGAVVAPPSVNQIVPAVPSGAPLPSPKRLARLRTKAMIKKLLGDLEVAGPAEPEVRLAPAHRETRKRGIFFVLRRFLFG